MKYLITTTLLLVFGTSAYMSVYGLAAVFSAFLPVVICMGAGLEMGKLLLVIWLHRSWKTMPWAGRVFYIAVATVLVAITSFEIMGFLSHSHVATGLGLRAAETEMAALSEETVVLQRQIAVIDDTLAGLPAGYVTRRLNERKKAGYADKQARLLAISRRQAEISSSIVKESEKAGPIFSVASVMGIRPDLAATIFILVLVGVLEPLSIGLAIAASAAWKKPADPAEIPAENSHTAETAENGQNAAGPASKGMAENGQTAESESGTKMAAARTRRDELLKISRLHKLSVGRIMTITGRKKRRTVRGWLDGQVEIPEKALRELRRFASRSGPLTVLAGGGQ